MATVDEKLTSTAHAALEMHTFSCGRPFTATELGQQHRQPSKMLRMLAARAPGFAKVGERGDGTGEYAVTDAEALQGWLDARPTTA